LYGINASGKSCLMKSVGLAIIMAQAGMYVPCEHMSYAPYNRLFTRISTGDDIYQGKSTFMVEMLEFRHILRFSTPESIVLGDEIAAGTESQSALAIVSAGINELARKGSSFIFTTHLHDLMNIPKITSLSNLKVSHLHAYVDQSTGDIVYDRTLRPGNGETTYGLLVCEALKMPLDFLRCAQETLQTLQGSKPWIETWKVSRYNTSKIISKCEICGEDANEAHHITHQAELKMRSVPKHVMHATGNLMSICAKCHDDLHANEISDNNLTTTLQCLDPNVLKPYLRLGSKTWMCRPTGRGKWTMLTDAKLAKLSKTLSIEPSLTQNDLSTFTEHLRDVTM
jgi:DNA mismatch repair protein MutS